MVKRKSSSDDDAYPVQLDSWWVVRGKRAHLFWCGSLLDVDPMPGSPPDLVYVDPPWIQESPQDDYLLSIYRQAAALAAGGPCFCETPRGYMLDADVLPDGVRYSWPLEYQRYKSALHYSGPEHPGFDPARRTDTEDVVDVILQAFTGETIIDPYSGRGRVAMAAERHGWASINMEPHPRRVSAALVRVGRVAGVEAKELA